MNYFNENLKLLRTSWGLSQTVLAKRYDVSQSAYGRWEVDAEPRLDVILDLAEFFKQDFGRFITKKLTLADVQPRHGGKKYAPLPDDAGTADVAREGDAELMQQVLDALEALRAAQAELRLELDALKKV